MKFVRSGLGKGGLRYLATVLLRGRRGHGRGDWLRLLLLANVLLCAGLVVLYVLRNHLAGWP